MNKLFERVVQAIESAKTTVSREFEGGLTITVRLDGRLDPPRCRELESIQELAKDGGTVRLYDRESKKGVSLTADGPTILKVLDLLSTLPE
jgi:hypothetical protein